MTAKPEQARALIRERILDGTYPPGHRLVLRVLATELGVSTIPVREALHALQAEGWVTIKRNSGAQVRSFDAREWIATMDALALLEGHATALAAPELTPSELDEARGIAADHDAAVRRQDLEAINTSNDRFHELFYALCRNDYVGALAREAAQRLRAAMRWNAYVIIPISSWSAQQDHDELLSLIEARADPRAIEIAARTHRLRPVAAYLEGRDAGGQARSTLGIVLRGDLVAPQ